MARASSRGPVNPSVSETTGAAASGRGPAYLDTLQTVDLASEMRQLLANMYAAFATGDTAELEKRLAFDALVIGTDDAEWWQGKDRLVPVLRAQTSEMRGAGIRLTGGEPEIAASGDTVWAADRPTMHLPDNDVPLRLTLLATEQNGTLVVRQMHLSVGAPNEDVLSQTLTV
jgi:hypothetical protein